MVIKICHVIQQVNGILMVSLKNMITSSPSFIIYPIPYSFIQTIVEIKSEYIIWKIMIGKLLYQFIKSSPSIIRGFIVLLSKTCEDLLMKHLNAPHKKNK